MIVLIYAGSVTKNVRFVEMGLDWHEYKNSGSLGPENSPRLSLFFLIDDTLHSGRKMLREVLFRFTSHLTFELFQDVL